MIWTNEAGDERIFSFAELSRLSVKAANALLALGVQPGEPVLLMLKRRYEYWLCAVSYTHLDVYKRQGIHRPAETGVC